jgi:peptidoglycan/xylan/chitin deacetylase (PgdA/CDA1 family)
MSFYLTRTPRWIQSLYPQRTWRIPSNEKILYLTFDDGPHPTVTPFVLDQLRQYDAKATFFCIGKNVDEHPDIYQRLIEEGHAVGNHTQHHVNGWQTITEDYLKDVSEAVKRTGSTLFRPPYGRLRSEQAKRLRRQYPEMKIVMWEVLSGDFDSQKNGDQCARSVIVQARPGSIIVFHDSTKAWDRLSNCLTQVLDHFYNNGYRFERIGPA